MRAQVSDSCPLTLTALGSQCLHVAPGACEELRLSLDQCAPPLDQAIFSTRPVRVFVICARGGSEPIRLAYAGRTSCGGGQAGCRVVMSSRQHSAAPCCSADSGKDWALDSLG